MENRKTLARFLAEPRYRRNLNMAISLHPGHRRAEDAPSCSTDDENLATIPKPPHVQAHGLSAFYGNRSGCSIESFHRSASTCGR